MNEAPNNRNDLTQADMQAGHQGEAFPRSPNVYEGGNAGQGSGGMMPLNLLRTVLRHWVTVVLLLICGGLGGVFYAQLVTPIYKAQAELEMSVRRPKVINSDAFFEDDQSRNADAIFNTRFTKFRSPAMERLATEEYFKQYPSESAEEGVADIGRGQLAASIRDVYWSKDPNANIVRVVCLGDDPEFAARLVNVLSYCAGVLMMRENQEQSDEAVKWLISQVEDQRDVLDDFEKQLANLREELHLDSLQQRQTVLEQALVSVSGERESLISTLSERKTVYDFVSELKDSDPDMEMLPAGLPREEQLNELLRAWRLANEELQLAADHFTELHPEYRKVAEKEGRARKRLEQFIELSSKAVQNEIELISKQIQQIDLRIQSMKDEDLELEQLLVAGTQQLQRLERKRDAADNAYQSMLRRMEEARLSADENMAFTKVIRKAEVPSVPVAPQKRKILFIGIVLGGFAGCFLSFIKELWMDRVGSVNDLKALGLNILGTIPPQKKVDSRGELATIGLRDNFNHLVEIFAGMNALMAADKFIERTRVLLVCSVMPGEGKTISSCNLAISAALNGSRTLLIDGDLRRPQLGNVFAIPEEHPSLLEWLHDGDHPVEVGQLASKNIIENLDVITSRPLTDINPAELLGRGRLAEILKWARSNYDRVIIDSPPLGPVGDAQMLANHSDSVILVSRVGKTRRRGLRFALARFREIDAHVLGCIANDVPHSIAGMFGGAEGYGYESGYGGYKSYGKQ